MLHCRFQLGKSIFIVICVDVFAIDCSMALTIFRFFVQQLFIITVIQFNAAKAQPQDDSDWHQNHCKNAQMHTQWIKC